MSDERCQATAHGSDLRCEREDGHDGIHTHGDEWSERGALKWMDDYPVFRERIRTIAPALGRVRPTG